jgi:hypothetical protein
MKRLLDFVRLPVEDEWLLIKSFLLLVVVRISLFVLPFRSVRWLLTQWKRRTVRADHLDLNHIRKVTWAIKSASIFVPRATCLTQGISVVLLLGQLGQLAHLKIGVAKGTSQDLVAHAWVESHGRVVLGNDTNPSHYTVLTPLRDEIL